MLTRARRTLGPVLAAGLVIGVLAGCGSDRREPDAEPSPTPSPSSPSTTSTSAASYLEAPEDVVLTEPGTALDLGDEALIAFEVRQGDTAALAVTVQRIERTSFRKSFEGWKVDEVVAARTPYFVRLAVTNVGEDLGGVLLGNVLWADDGTTLEAPSYYTARQLRDCSGGPLPKSFPTGSSTELCQVYFIAPGRKLRAVTFQPQAGLEPITWTGDVSKKIRPPKKQPRKQPKKKQ